MGSNTFSGEILQNVRTTVIDNGGGWCMIGTCRSDNRPFALQWTRGEFEPRIVAGCRYMTISEADRHYHSGYRPSGYFDDRKTAYYRRLCLESRAIISALLHRAHLANRLLKKPTWKVEPPLSPVAREALRVSKKKVAKKGKRRG